MGQVPQGERAVRPGQVRDRGQIGDRRGPVVDVRQDDQGQVLIRDPLDVLEAHTLDLVLVEPADLEVPSRSESLDDVAIRREFASADRDRPTLGSRVKRGRREPKQVDCRRIRDQDLARLGADEPSELITDATRRIKPVIPAANQFAGPLPRGDPRDGLDRRERRAPERVAVEVDELRIGHRESAAERAQRIVRVEGPCLIEVWSVHRRQSRHGGAPMGGLRGATQPRKVQSPRATLARMTDHNA